MKIVTSDNVGIVELSTNAYEEELVDLQLSDCRRIRDMLLAAYRAGAKGEDVEIICRNEIIEEIQTGSGPSWHK